MIHHRDMYNRSVDKLMYAEYQHLRTDHVSPGIVWTTLYMSDEPTSDASADRMSGVIVEVY